MPENRPSLPASPATFCSGSRWAPASWPGTLLLRYSRRWGKEEFLCHSPGESYTLKYPSSDSHLVSWTQNPLSFQKASSSNLMLAFVVMTPPLIPAQPWDAELCSSGAPLGSFSCAGTGALPSLPLAPLDHESGVWFYTVQLGVNRSSAKRKEKRWREGEAREEERGRNQNCTVLCTWANSPQWA